MKQELEFLDREDVQNRLVVKCEDDEEGDIHPQCVHGPTILFYYEDKGPEHGYYGCSAYRDKKLCPFNVPASELNVKHFRRQYDTSTVLYRSARKEFLEDGEDTQKHYCLSCNKAIVNDDLPKHFDHNVKQNLPKHYIQDPTLFLPPLNNDKAQAQYFFDEKSLQFFENTLHDLKISKIICMGAPRLHCYLSSKPSNQVKSYLLDLDHRFIYFYDDTSFAWYNMCNNHFFDELQKQEFFKFLKCQSDERLLIFTDPPFGCRTELIGSTLNKLSKLYSKINQIPYQPLPIFWVFPYFLAQYIQKVLPSLQMSDYKINYTNHDSYTDIGKSARKQGSPVRLFTNVPLDILKLPVKEQYKYCSKCQKYTALENRHCEICKCCPSKNGSTYVHCNQCGLCVKPSYVHCRNCRRCTQKEGHNCSEYQKHQTCYICRNVGHTEKRCLFWRKKVLHQMFPPKETDSENIIVCILCNKIGHNELSCDQRSFYLKELTFMGETQLCENVYRMPTLKSAGKTSVNSFQAF
ncbi:rRNA N6-adenosine-methyltransferase ZCCHC4 [Musca domestica]|uniref:rRNA N6-adenosine-methyltransferase ZCCHC4 n=1 Tax=Musca domestica TaxID=7370 RepID=A0A9J7I4C4_MUSDO|nr:rRNA N6-adenosine-methyltransferase ZCCHC4 [Musca domestica]